MQSRSLWRITQPAVGSSSSLVLQSVPAAAAATPASPKHNCLLTRHLLSPPPAVGIEAEAERVQKLLAELEGKDINEVRRCCNLSCQQAVCKLRCSVWCARQLPCLQCRRACYLLHLPLPLLLLPAHPPSTPRTTPAR